MLRFYSVFFLHDIIFLFINLHPKCNSSAPFVLETVNVFQPIIHGEAIVYIFLFKKKIKIIEEKELFQIKKIGDIATRYYHGDYPVDEQELELVKLDADRYESIIVEFEDAYASPNYYVGQIIKAEVRYSLCNKCGHCHPKAYCYSLETIPELDDIKKEKE